MFATVIRVEDDYSLDKNFSCVDNDQLFCVYKGQATSNGLNLEEGRFRFAIRRNSL